MKSRLLGAAFAIISLSALAPACGGSNGGEGAACYPNGTCDSGLVCQSDTCVDPNAPGGGNAFIQECLSCGETSCKTEADACDAAAGCGAALQCWLECIGDTSCTNACDVSQITSADIPRLSAYFGCLGRGCLQDCVPDVSGTGGQTGSGGGNASGGNASGGSSAGGACVPGNKSLGSCATGNYQSCNGLTYETGDCTTCSIVTPSTSCVKGEAFVLREESEGVVVPVPESKPTLVAVDGVSVAASFSLEYFEFGVLQYEFTTEVNPATFRFTSGGSPGPIITVESAIGGCTYYHNTTTNGIARQISVDWNGCWGTFATIGAGAHPTGATIVNFRTSTLTSSINITGIVL